MAEYHYKLEPGSKKHRCIQCHKKTYVRYIDTNTNQYTDPVYGRCDREYKCGYHHIPRKTGYVANKPIMKPDNPIVKKPVIPRRAYAEVLNTYDKNQFILNLKRQGFDYYDIQKAIELYYLGTYKKAIVFPFIDSAKFIRAAQVKQFDQANHTTKTNWLHSLYQYKYKRLDKALPDWLEDYLKADCKATCLFGEHLIDRFPDRSIALVEAPKTAIYCTLALGMPDIPGNYLWLATGGLSYLNYERCQSLNNRKVTLFPDLGATKKWQDRVNTIQQQMPNTTFIVSTFLEDNAGQSDIEQGLDLADYITKCSEDAQLFATAAQTENPGNKAFTQPAQHTQGNDNKMRLLPDDKRFIDQLLQSIPASNRPALWAEYESQWWQAYHQEAIHHKKDNAARRAANIWLREIIKPTRGSNGTSHH